ncbi:MAG TPA: argininosuccinate synthase [Chthoniobacterales bacterium]|nr:argininosuccinate synthase [Chthoniobacterales bacterium]
MKIVLAYSGGLDTSVILRWLKKNYQAEIIAFCADIGQEEELKGLEEKALKTGAVKYIIEDLREEFARDFIFPMIQAGAIYEGQYFLGTSIARPLIAKRMVEISRKEKADAIAHGATGKGNDQVRFELTAAALAPELQVIAPWREERFRKEFPGRAEMIAFAKANKIPVEASAEKPYSTDRNLLHISFESGVLEDPWFDASSKEMRDMYKLSVAPEDAPDEPEHVDLAFENGNCVSVVQVSNLRTKKIGGTRAVVSQNLGADSAAPSMSPLGVMQTLNKLGGKHGIGRVDIVENRFVGMKGRGVYETPGGAILHFAHRQMETLTMDREVMHLRDSLIPKYSTLVYNGLWFSPEREALQALVTETQRDVAGVVRLKLYKGNIIVAGRKSPKSLYDPKIATMESGRSTYDQGDATGFIRLNALRLRVRAALKSRDSKSSR